MARGRLRGFRPERLRLARQAAGLTQEQLAIRTDISRASIGSWEAGRTAPDPRNAVRLAQALHLSIQALTGITVADAQPADFRLWRGLTRQMVAELSGVAEPVLGQIERFAVRPGPDTASRLARLFGIERRTYLAAWERGRARLSAGHVGTGFPHRDLPTTAPDE